MNTRALFCSLIIAFCLRVPARAATTFYHDSFLGENNYTIGYGKWGVANAVNAVCQDTRAVVQPNHGYYGFANLWPLDINGTHAAFESGDAGITIALDLGPWTATTERMLMKLAMLDRSITTDPWAPLATGVIAFVNLYDGTNLTLQLTTKSTTNDNGAAFAVTSNVPWRSGARFALQFADTTVSAVYDGVTIAAGPHGLPDVAAARWHPAITLANAPWPTNQFTIGNVCIEGAGAAIRTEFADDFTGPDGAPPDSNKWTAVQTGGAWFLTNNGCCLAPSASDWSVVDLMMKENYGTELRLSAAQEVVITAIISDVTAAVPDGTLGFDIDLHVDLLPERWQRTGWWLNGTSLFAEVRFDISSDGAQTNVKAYLYQHTVPRSTGSLISTILGQYAFRPGAALVLTFSDWSAVAEYDGRLLYTASLPDMAMYELFPGGMVMALGVKKVPGASGTSLTLDSCEAYTMIPEPGALLLAALLVALGARRGHATNSSTNEQLSPNQPTVR